MTILSKLINLFSVIPIKLLRHIFNELEKTVTKFIWKNKRTIISREIMKKNVMEGGLAVPNLKLYHKNSSHQNNMVLAKRQKGGPVE